jgi:pilus assembly protein Flp/PilA
MNLQGQRGLWGLHSQAAKQYYVEDQNMKSLIVRFVKDQSGATAIEYGLIAAGLGVVIIGLFGTAGQGIPDLLSDLIANVRTTAGV